MDSKVFVRAELSQDCIRDCSDTHLKTGSVFNKFGTMASDCSLNLVRLTEMGRLERSIPLNKNINH